MKVREGHVYFYRGTGRNPRTKRVLVKGFRRSFAVTEGVDDGRRRDVPVSQLSEVPEK